MKFRITTILYVFALLSAAMALDPGVGFVLTIVVLAVWTFIFTAPISRNRRIEFSIVFLGVGLLPAILVTGAASTHHDRTPSCARSLSDLAKAVIHYANRNGKLPQNTISKDGALLSWRTLLLADLGDGQYAEKMGLQNGNVAQKINEISKNPPMCYWHSCGQRTYCAVRGDNTAWSISKLPQKPRACDNDTVLLIEVGENLVGPWYEPVDLTFDEAVELLTIVPNDGSFDGHYRREHFFRKSPCRARNVAFTDGTVRTIHVPISRELATGMLTAHGGESIYEELESASQPPLDVSKCVVFTFFMTFAALPTLRAIKKLPTDNQ